MVPEIMLLLPLEHQEEDNRRRRHTIAAIIIIVITTTIRSRSSRANVPDFNRKCPDSKHSSTVV